MRVHVIGRPVPGSRVGNGVLDAVYLLEGHDLPRGVVGDQITRILPVPFRHLQVHGHGGPNLRQGQRHRRLEGGEHAHPANPGVNAFRLLGFIIAGHFLRGVIPGTGVIAALGLGAGIARFAPHGRILDFQARRFSRSSGPPVSVAISHIVVAGYPHRSPATRHGLERGIIGACGVVTSAQMETGFIPGVTHQVGNVAIGGRGRTLDQKLRLDVLTRGHQGVSLPDDATTRRALTTGAPAGGELVSRGVVGLAGNTHEVLRHGSAQFHLHGDLTNVVIRRLVRARLLDPIKTSDVEVGKGICRL